MGGPEGGSTPGDAMSLPQPISPGMDPCILVERWTISQELASRLILMAGRLEFGVKIISGWRSRELQEDLIRQGVGAPVDRSTHCSCPATGADLWPDVAVTEYLKARFGEAAVSSGLRWGGGSPVNPENGIPSDWNHVDLGPRP